MKLLKWFRNIDILSAEDQYKYATQYAISNILDSKGFTFKRIKSRIKEASKKGLKYLYITIEKEKRERKSNGKSIIFFFRNKKN